MADSKNLCPICKSKDSQFETRPFCSKRCADVDLHRWLGGHYAVPAVEPPDEWDIDAAQDEAGVDKADMH